MKLSLLILSVCSVVQSTDPTLLFSDDFARDEAMPGKEDIGNGWTSNSGWRAKGHQQVDLIDGKETGSFSSEGIAHPTKRMITLAVNKSADMDDVKVWRLK